jgi:type I restriction enzyme, S subunit
MGSFGVTGWHDRAKVSGPGVTVGRSGASFGVVSHVRDAYWPLNTCLYVDDYHGNDPLWVYLLLSQIDFKGYNSGSAQPSLNRNYIKHIEVAVPPVPEQRRIAGVLGAFDDLIDTNRKLAGKLEEFSFAYCGQCAEDAPVVPFEDLATRVVDRAAPGSWEDSTTYLGLEHFGLDGVGLIGRGTVAGIQSTSLRFEPGDVLYGKLRPYFRKVARPGFSGVCSSEIWVLRPREGHSGAPLHAVAQSPVFSAIAMAGNSGTKMPRAGWDHIAKMMVPDLRGVLTSLRVEALDDLWTAACGLRAESANLATHRDELLPLLMSGKVRVSELEGVA